MFGLSPRMTGIVMDVRIKSERTIWGGEKELEGDVNG